MSIYLGNTAIGNGNYLGNLNIRDSNIFMSQSVAAAGPTYPNQSLATWTATETAAWLAAGTTQTTASFGYSSSSTRLGASLGAGSAKYGGAALASNGKIYSPGVVETNFLVVNTNNDTRTTAGTSLNALAHGARYDKITDTVYSFGSGGCKIVCSTDTASNISGPSNRNGGAVQSFDGNKLYTIGLFSNNFIFEYNISGNTSTSKVSVGDANTAGTLGSNGKIYWGVGGGGSTQYKEYDPATNTLVLFGSETTNERGPMCAHYNGYIYNFPTATAATIKKIDISTNTVSTAHTLSISPNILTNATCIGLDGRIYATRENGGVYWYDPYSNTSGTITMDSGDTSFNGITMGANGDLYAMPYDSAYVHKIALTTGAGATATQIVSQYNFGGRMCWQ